MSVAHHVIQVDGKPVGYALDLDERYVFYTVHPALKHLDDRRFEDLEGLRNMVTQALKKPKSVQPASA